MKIYPQIHNGIMQDWYIATGVTSLGQRYQGYGTTHIEAIKDALKDYKLTTSLK